MKTKVLIFIISALLFQATPNLNAQLKAPPAPEYIELKEGDLTYLLNNAVFTLERPETKDLNGKSYEYFYLGFEEDYGERVIFPILRSVFSKERANQLSELKFHCFIVFSPVENRILHIIFMISGEKDRDKNDDRIPLKLCELYELEKKLRAEPNLIPFKAEGKIVDHAERINFRIFFDRLYTDKD